MAVGKLLLILQYSVAAFSTENSAIFVSTKDEEAKYVRSYSIDGDSIRFQECLAQKGSSTSKKDVIIFRKADACLLVDPNSQAEFVHRLIEKTNNFSDISLFTVYTPFIQDIELQRRLVGRATSNLPPTKVQFVKGNQFKTVVTILSATSEEKSKIKKDFLDLTQSGEPLDPLFFEVEIVKVPK